MSIQIRNFHEFDWHFAIFTLLMLILNLSCVINQQKGKKWVIQLIAVSCLSLAAKMDEVYVPLLVDLQVKLVFNYSFVPTV